MGGGQTIVRRAHGNNNKQQAMCSTYIDIWWPVRAHQQDRDKTLTPLKEQIPGTPHTKTEKCLGGWAGGGSGVVTVGQAHGVEVGPEE